MQRVLDLWKDDNAKPVGSADAYVLGKPFPVKDAGTDTAQFGDEFEQEVKKLVWLMYRTQFPTPIPRDPEGPSPLFQNVNAFFRSGPAAVQASNLLDSFTSDVGWGCMIRTGQSLLANALLRLNNFNYNVPKSLAKGPDNRNVEGTDPSSVTEPVSVTEPSSVIEQSSVVETSSVVENDGKSDTVHSGSKQQPETIEILRLFRDEPDAPYSIHKFVSHGAQYCGKLPGQWFGPSAVAACIAEFAKPQLSTYISQGMDVYENELRELQFPVLVLCNLRLGISEINPIYYEGLRALLTNKYSVGIAGGRTSASHYFYGVQGSQLFFHDPHEPKPAITAASTDEEILESLNTARLRALDFKEMDPSMLVGFLLPSPEDVDEFKSLLEKVPYRERVIHVSTQKPRMEMLNLDDNSDDEGELSRDAQTEDNGYVMCSTPEPELPETIEANQPADESMTEIKN